MAIEKQKAEEERRERQEDEDRENDVSKDEYSEPATDQKLESEVDQAVGDRDQTPNEQAENLSSSEAAVLPQRNMTEGSEKVPNSREKRESRRQRGLEHNELQNKHVMISLEGPSLLYHEEQTSSEEALEAAPVPKESTAQDAVLQGSGERVKSPREEKALSDMPPPSEIKGSSSIPEQPPVSEVDDKAVDGMKAQGNQNNQTKGSQSSNCPQRPTNLALNVHNAPAATGSFETPAESWADKNKRHVQKTLKDLDSPTSSQIQRYVDDPEKLKYKREKWKGKRQSDASQSDMLSQSLDERTRGDKSPQDQLK